LDMKEIFYQERRLRELDLLRPLVKNMTDFNYFKSNFENSGSSRNY